MRKARNSKLALLLVLTMLATMFVGIGTASAAGNITALSTPTIADTTGQTLGMIRVVIPAGSVQNGDVVHIKLPSGFDFGTLPTVAATDTPATLNEIVVPATLDGVEANGLVAGNYAITTIGTDEIQLAATTAQSLLHDAVFYIELNDIDVDSGKTGDVTVTFDGPVNTAFPMGTVVVGRVNTSGAITLTTSGTQTSNNNFAFTLRIKEDIAGSLELGNESITIDLPSGYAWTTAAANGLNRAGVWGNGMTYNISFNPGGDELRIRFLGRWVDANGNGVVDATEVPGAVDANADTFLSAAELAANTAGSVTAVASAWDIPLTFTVDDDSKVTSGDIEAIISGNSSINTGTVKVGTYGEFGATIETETTVPEIYAGLDEQKIAKITVKESLAGSLLEGRSVTLELPSCARWQDQYDGTTQFQSTTNNGLQIQSAGFTGGDDRTAKFTVMVGPLGGAIATTAKATVEFKNVEVVVEPGFTGDLKVKVGGTAGLTGELTVANVLAPVTMTATDKPTVVIGKKSQSAGDFEITETKAGAITDNGALTINLSDGATWAAVPTVEVTAGNLSIGTPAFAGANLTIPIDGKSTSASTIKVSGVKITLDRTIPEGDISVRARGLAVIDGGAAAVWANSTNAAKVANAVVGTPAPGETAGTAVFTIGNAKYNLNGTEIEMGANPYVKNGRTYLPLRFVGNAIGIDNNNIWWDAATKTATLKKDNTIVQVKIGSKSLLVNGVAVGSMDVAPEIKDGFTMLPIRPVVEAFGAQVDWDQTTQTATVSF